MAKLLGRMKVALKATRELGLRQTFWYMLYQAGLRSGYYRRATSAGANTQQAVSICSPFQPPDAEQVTNLLGDRKLDLLREAEEITEGMVRLFGGPPVPLELKPPDSRHHWTYYEGRPGTWGVDDVKYVWEPARFGWAYVLGRAYLVTGDERYPHAFWLLFETFLQHNPPNQGLNWMSAQEVALRLMAFLFASCAFNRSAASTRERQALMAGAVAAHAQRIPPTLSYALAQNNNHLISETLGLYAAGCALPDHPQAAAWRQKGWYWLNYALQTQILEDGTYAQHSMNYHRLMLHAALQAPLFGKKYPKRTARRLAAAVTWLLAQVDPRSGKAPNLGSNDGALILPLAAGGFSDYRPVAQAAARAFLGGPAYPPGAWDELGLWLGQTLQQDGAPARFPECPAVHRLGSPESWGTLRAVRFRGRPSHADQLHVDLWWRGENIALDAGTYRYTAPPPWDNALARTPVHNTIEVNRQDQMVKAGRFLWLDWAHADVLDTRTFQAQTLAAEHRGYRRLGVVHRRMLKLVQPNHWQVTDHLQPSGPINGSDPHATAFTFRIHWLLPDWPWDLEGETLTLHHPAGGRVTLALSHLIPHHPHVKVGALSLVRAGQALVGPKRVSPVRGWFAPTYGYKIPALSLSQRIRSPLPVTLLSDWLLEE